LSSVLRKYYTLAAKALGLQDTKDGIRTGGESNPIGSLAAFTFAETDELSPLAKSKGENHDEDKLSPGSSSRVGNKQDQSGDLGEFTESVSPRGVKRSASPSTAPDLESKPKFAKRGL